MNKEIEKLLKRILDFNYYGWLTKKEGDILSDYIKSLQHRLEQSKNFIKMIKDESYQSSVTGICDVALKELGDLDE